MSERFANLYAEKALNNKLFAEGMISERMHRIANEGIALDIDRISKKAYAYNITSDDRGMSDGIAKRAAASR